MQLLKNLLVPTAVLSVFLISCGQSNSPYTSASATEEITMSAAIPDTSVAVQNERVLIKSANLNMDVSQMEQSVQEFQSLINRLQGHVYHYTVKNEKIATREVKSSLDSTTLIHEIHPYAVLKVKIPVHQGDSFIQTVLKMNGTISDFNFDENDITENITESKELMLSNAGVSKNKTTSIDQQYFDQEAKEDYIHQKAQFSKLAYQTKYLWFDIQLSGLNYTNTQVIATQSSLRTPFYVRAVEAVQRGWYGFSVFLTLLISIWPFLAMGLVVFFTVRASWFKKLLHR